MTTQESQLKYGTVSDFNEKNYNKRFIFVLNHNNEKPSTTVDGIPQRFPASFFSSIGRRNI